MIPAVSSTLAADLRQRGFELKEFADHGAFAAALPLAVGDQVLEGWLFAVRRVGQAEIFVLEYSHQRHAATYDQPVRRLVNMRHPMLVGVAMVSPTARRTFFRKTGWLGRSLLILLAVLLAVPLLLLWLLSKLFKARDARGGVRFGGAFDRQFKVFARNEASARALLAEPLRQALVDSELTASLDFNDGLTVAVVGDEDTLAAVDALPSLVGASPEP